MKFTNNTKVDCLWSFAGLQSQNGDCAHYIIESKVQWKPFWLATQQYPQNDWLGGNFQYTMTYAHGPHSIFTLSGFPPRSVHLEIIQGTSVWYWLVHNDMCPPVCILPVFFIWSFSLSLFVLLLLLQTMKRKTNLSFLAWSWFPAIRLSPLKSTTLIQV